jgi:hypothetical protein
MDNSVPTFSAYRLARRESVEPQIGKHDRFSQQNTNLFRQLIKDLNISDVHERIFRFQQNFSRQLNGLLLDDSALNDYATSSSIFRGHKRDLILNRLRKLSQSDTMSDYKWTSERSIRVPQDAEILIDVFFWIFTTGYPAPVSPWLRESFISSHFIQLPNVPSEIMDLDVCIFESVLTPPHFEIAFSNGKETETWYMAHGRENAFLALYFFLIFIREKKNGTLRLRGMTGNFLQSIEKFI